MCQELVTRIPDPNVVIAMEPEEIAGVLLPILRQRLIGSDDINLYNFMLEFNQGRGIPGYKSNCYAPEFIPRIKTAVLEAIEWMFSAGLLAHVPGQYSHHSAIITRRGLAIQSTSEFADFRKASLLSPQLLHKKIARTAWPTFIRGKHETAVFEAFKEVEIAVRAACGYDARVIGVDLMRSAFHHENGPLTDKTLPAAERESLSALFAGAIGSYKNPASHRTVTISEAVEAGEMLILASHLLRIVDDRASRLGKAKPSTEK